MTATQLAMLQSLLQQAAEQFIEHQTAVGHPLTVGEAAAVLQFAQQLPVGRLLKDLQGL